MCLTTNVKFIIYQLQNKSMIVNTLYYSIFYFILLYMIPMINALKPHEFRCRLFKLQQLLNSVNDVQHFLIEVIEISLDQTLDMEEFQIDIMNDIQQKVFNSLVDSKSKMIKYEQLVNTVLYKNGHNFEENPQELINCLRACDGNKDSYINYDDFSEFIANWSPVMVNNVMQSNIIALTSRDVETAVLNLKYFLDVTVNEQADLASSMKIFLTTMFLKNSIGELDNQVQVSDYIVEKLNNFKKTVFMKYLADKKSKNINVQDLITIVNKNNSLHECNKRIFSEFIEKQDKNEDGYIDFNEFCSIISNWSTCHLTSGNHSKNPSFDTMFSYEVTKLSSETSLPRNYSFDKCKKSVQYPNSP
ncbi:uncharacterized protein LOC126901522 isoform X2 [Daktulosphaira vitifoliae]|uniref:uncharacterized protein LOC126901522 isoform X2 n=1 Tax=Daktulosphaira vitifoliae TaxID=58002 RepID=UPI0021A97AA2|nr:uncharacterized protein LOC126901522 isoform X2 [Daktulosphaira vitifoliae]